MSVASRLSEVYASAPTVTFDAGSRLAIISDCHRGDNSWADDFARNEAIYLRAMHYYYENEFTYIELGDGDELIENPRFEAILCAHHHVFKLLNRFHREERMHFIYGNHNIPWKYPANMAEDLSATCDHERHRVEQLFQELQPIEGLILQHTGFWGKLFLVHGHQGQLFEDRFWRVGEFMVRHLWRPLQRYGIRDPMRAALNPGICLRIEKDIQAWIRENNQPVICGHTHRAALADPGEVPYFNSGACVFPRDITAIEIQDDHIELVKWHVLPRAGGTLEVVREVLAGPYLLQNYFGS